MTVKQSDARWQWHPRIFPIDQIERSDIFGIDGFIQMNKTKKTKENWEILGKRSGKCIGEIYILLKVFLSEKEKGGCGLS